MGEKDVTPSRKEQKEIVETYLGKSVTTGDTWYIIDSKWMRSLKLYLGMDEWGSSAVSYPGPIDNSKLFDEETGEIKKALMEQIHYELIPEECWKALVSWFGIMDGQEPIARSAIRIGNYGGNAVVEVYLLELKCVKDFNYDNEKKIKVSKADYFAEIHKRMRDLFDIPNDMNSRLWHIMHRHGQQELIGVDKTPHDIGLSQYQFVVLETQKPDGSWFNECNVSSSSSSLIAKSRRKFVTMATTSQAPKPPGLCGLINLGNTCFMNSVLQCMSNCPSITEYFLSGKHLLELNEMNPLGMKGEIAKAFGELIEVMWSGSVAYTVPQNFKIQVGKFNPTFSGCHQHDSQELLTFLLDGLHEDLNRIIRKPYIPVKDDNKREDAVVAQETWDNYRKRNDSIIVDTFHGLLKSRVVCPECENVSVTFDPFCYLSLPLPPLKKDRYLTVRYIPYEGTQRETIYKVIVPKKGTIRDLCMELSQTTNGDPDHMLVAEITNCHFHRFFCGDDLLETIEDKDVIFIFQLHVVPNPLDTQYMIFPVCFWELCSPNDIFSQKHIFGIPFVIVLKQQPISCQDLHREIVEKMQRHFNFNCIRNNMQNGDYNFEDTVKDKECNYQDSLFKLYIVDASMYSNPRKLDPVDGFYDLKGILGNEPEKSFGRHTILLQFTPDQRREFYDEKPPDQVAGCTSDIREKSKITIQTCLRLFNTCEKLGADNTWYCPTCDKHQRATKKFDLWKLPKILIIHLKRFSYNHLRRDKIDTLVEFPITDLRMDDYVISSTHSYMYDLLGVINHYGNMGGGHYTAFCKNKDTKKWYCFDDNMVTQVMPTSIMTSAAYVLFYMMKDPRQQDTDIDFMDVN